MHSRFFRIAVAACAVLSCGTPQAEPSGSDTSSEGETGPPPCETLGEWGGSCCALAEPCPVVEQTCSGAGCQPDGVANPDASQCVFDGIANDEIFMFQVKRPDAAAVATTTTYWYTGEWFVAWESGISDGMPLDDWFTCRRPVGPAVSMCQDAADSAGAFACILQVCNTLESLGTCDPGAAGDGDGDDDGTTESSSESGCVFVCGDGDSGDSGPAETGDPIPPGPDPCDTLVTYACPG